MGIENNEPNAKKEADQPFYVAFDLVVMRHFLFGL